MFQSVQEGKNLSLCNSFFRTCINYWYNGTLHKDMEVDQQVLPSDLIILKNKNNEFTGCYNRVGKSAGQL